MLDPRSARLLSLLVLGLGCLLGVAVPERGHAQSAASPAPLRQHRSSVTEGMDCSACHTPDSWKSVSQSSSRSGFDHARTGFPLTQRHASVPCAGCHSIS